MRYAWIFVLLLAMWTSHAYALDNELQHWEMVTLRVDTPHRLSVYTEVQHRGGLNRQGMERLLIRPALGYRISPKVSVWQGYAWIPAYREDAPDEHRIYQQLLVDNKFKRFIVSNRTRLEERWVDKAGGTALRVRHQLRAMHPLDPEEKWFLVGYHEVFWNINSSSRGPQAGFDQQRSFAGIHRKLGRFVQAEMGYLLHHLHHPKRNSDKLNHVVLISLNLHLK